MRGTCLACGHHVGDVCERCGFVPEHVCQLDVHKHREDLSKRETLCANCHRLITLAERGVISILRYPASSAETSSPDEYRMVHR